jgi:hypothetical protein
MRFCDLQVKIKYGLDEIKAVTVVIARGIHPKKKWR